MGVPAQRPEVFRLLHAQRARHLGADRPDSVPAVRGHLVHAARCTGDRPGEMATHRPRNHTGADVCRPRMGTVPQRQLRGAVLLPRFRLGCTGTGPPGPHRAPPPCRAAQHPVRHAVLARVPVCAQPVCAQPVLALAVHAADADRSRDPVHPAPPVPGSAAPSRGRPAAAVPGQPEIPGPCPVLPGTAQRILLPIPESTAP